MSGPQVGRGVPVQPPPDRRVHLPPSEGVAHESSYPMVPTRHLPPPIPQAPRGAWTGGGRFTGEAQALGCSPEGYSG